MNLTSAQRRQASREPQRSAEDEWGLFDPQQAGMPALMRTLHDERQRHPATASEPLDLSTRVAQPGSLQGVDQPAPAIDATAPSGRGASGAVYTVEATVRCPECEAEIRTLRVLRVLRTQVSFTSTLPRKGYVVMCPACERILSAELSGLV